MKLAMSLVSTIPTSRSRSARPRGGEDPTFCFAKDALQVVLRGAVEVWGGCLLSSRAQCRNDYADYRSVDCVIGLWGQIFASDDKRE